MNTRTLKICGMWILLAWLAAFSAIPAQGAKDEIKSRMKNRYEKINELKKNGKIGENPQGFVEVVSPKAAGDSAITIMVTDENKDRKALYELIGQESQTPAEEVGMANAKRIFQKATDVEYFKSSEGAWKKKKDMAIEKPE